MANSKLEARNVNLAKTDWQEIEAYSQRIGIRGVSAALRYMLQERRNLLLHAKSLALAQHTNTQSS